MPKKIKDGAYVINLDEYEYANVGYIRLLYFVEEVKLFISMLNMFLKKLNNFSGIKTSKQTFFKYNQTIQ